MKTDTNIQLRAQASRLRGRGHWGLVIGIIGLVGCAVGVVQFWMYGIVSIRPGHDPMSGDEAVALLLFLFVVSVAFSIYGRVMIHRARRILEG